MSGGRAARRRGEQTSGIFVVLFVLSGAAGLVHEVVWMRLLGHVFGATAAAASTVLAAYMGGLALGSVFAAPIARLVGARRAYATLELGIAATAILVPLLLAATEAAYLHLWPAVAGMPGVRDATRFAAACLPLLPPTVLMGATLPVLVGQLGGAGGVASVLYAANLAGAVLGVIVAGFLAMPTIGVWGAMWVGVALNLLAGGLAWPRLAAYRPPPAPPADGRGLPGHLLAAAVACGALSFGWQVAWTRVLVLIVGASSYAFSAVVLGLLLALAAAGTWSARWPLSGPPARGRLVAGFLASAVAMGVAAAAVDRLPAWYLHLILLVRPQGLVGIVGLSLLVTVTVLAPGFACIGLVLPTVLGGVPDDAAAPARVARLYAVNTVGAIVGAVLVGFVLVPVIGPQRTLAWLGVGASLAALGVSLAGATDRRWTAGALVGLLATIGQLLGQPLWNPQPLSRGVFEPANIPNEADLATPDERVLFQRDGAVAAVAVVERGGARSLRISGRANASDHPTDMPTQILLAQLPVLLAEHTADVLVIGWGSGITVGSLLQGPVERVTAVELEPAVVEASVWFAHVNHEPLRDPRLRLVLDDARHLLGAETGTYDVIVSEPSHPWVTGVASLFTDEFFRRAATRLRDDGVFVQWLQGYQISADSFRSVVRTFQSVFPEMLLFRSSQADDFFLVGRRQPWRLDLDALAARFAHPGIRAECTRVGLTEMEHVLATLFLTPEQNRKLAAQGVLNTDANMHVELQAPRELLGLQDPVSDRWFESMAGVVTPFGSLLRDPDGLRARPERAASLLQGLALSQRGPQRFADLVAIAGPPP